MIEGFAIIGGLGFAMIVAAVVEDWLYWRSPATIDDD
jgi:hypothetical protein